VRAATVDLEYIVGHAVHVGHNDHVDADTGETIAHDVSRHKQVAGA
jgi:hypothetical protein